jgi:hypothetical protein
MTSPVRVTNRLAFVIVVAGLLSTGAIDTGAGAPLSASSTAGLRLTVGVSNEGPLTSCDVPPNTPCPLESVTQFLLYVHNSNPLANFVGLPTPNRTTVPNAYVLSRMDRSITIDGAPYGAGTLTATPPPNAEFPEGAGRWPATAVCTPTTGPPPCATVKSPAILPGETTAAMFIGWSHGSDQPNGEFVFTFTLHGTLNGQPVSLTATSPAITMKTAKTPGWASAASMPTARAYLAAATGHDKRIYAIGGDNGTGFLNTVEAYQPATNTWATMTSMPTARGFLAAATGPDGRIYAIGGFNGGYLNTVEAYTPGTGPDGRIYAIGGGNSTGFLNTVEVYTPGTNSWATVASMPTARAAVAGAAGRGTDKRVYAIGGYNSCCFFNNVDAYTPGTNTWATAASMPTARSSLGAATGADGRIYAVGGNNFGGYLNAAEAYTPSTNSWATVASMPTARAGLAAATGPDKRIYAIGGRNSSSFLNTVEAYTPG